MTEHILTDYDIVVADRAERQLFRDQDAKFRGAMLAALEAGTEKLPGPADFRDDDRFPIVRSAA